MKVVIKSQAEAVLVLWTDNDLPFVVAWTPGKTYAPGHIIHDWYYGSYFKTIDEALANFNKKIHSVIDTEV